MNKTRSTIVGIGLIFSVSAVVIALVTNNVWWNLGAIAIAVLGSFIAGRGIE